MTREEIISHSKARDSEAKRFDWRFMLVYLGGMLLVGLPFTRAPKERWELHLLGLFLLFGWLLAPIHFLIRKAKKDAQKHQLLCPSCTKPLGPFDVKIAIASGRCCHCGHQLITD